MTARLERAKLEVFEAQKAVRAARQKRDSADRHDGRELLNAHSDWQDAHKRYENARAELGRARWAAGY